MVGLGLRTRWCRSGFFRPLTPNDRNRRSEDEIGYCLVEFNKAVFEEGYALEMNDFCPLKHYSGRSFAQILLFRLHKRGGQPHTFSHWHKCLSRIKLFYSQIVSGQSRNLPNLTQFPKEVHAIAVHSSSKRFWGEIFLAINSHQPLPMVQSACMRAPICTRRNGWNIIGGLFLEEPMIFLAVNENWDGHITVNFPDSDLDTYQFEINPENEWAIPQWMRECLELEEKTIWLSGKAWDLIYHHLSKENHEKSYLWPTW